MSAASGLLTVALILVPVLACASGFEGTWEVVSVEVAEPQSEWAEPGQLLQSLEIRRENSRLVALYTSRTGLQSHCMNALEVIEGYEVIVFGCPAPYKTGEILSPIHRVKLQGGELMGYAITDRVIYRWSAKRRR